MMLQMPNMVENKDKGVGMQVWKMEETLIKKELVGEQCAGSDEETLAWSQNMVKKWRGESPLDGTSSNSAKKYLLQYRRRYGNRLTLGFLCRPAIT